jgi:hypothetical protein
MMRGSFGAALSAASHAGIAFVESIFSGKTPATPDGRLLS